MTKIMNLFIQKVAETMLGPIFARAKFSEKYPEFLNDQKAVEICNQIDYDFSEIEQYLGEWRGLGLMARAKSFDIKIIEFIESHPNATIVNLGAGLDTTFYRVDNHKIAWYDLDLPEAIEFRKELIPEGERVHYVQKSALDTSWFDDVNFNRDNGIIFIAGGFVYYFKKEDISNLIIQMANQYPGGEMVFDATSKLANAVINLRAKKAGVNDLRVYFAVGNPNKLFPKWSPNIKVLDWHGIWERFEINPNWNPKTIAAIKKSERLKAAKIVHLRFLGNDEF